MDTEQAIMLVEYNQWANHRLLLKAAHLTLEQLTTSTWLSYHSVFATLIHILDTQWYWREGAQYGNLPLQTLSPVDFPDIAALRKRWYVEDRALLGYVGGLSVEDLSGLVTYTWPRARPRSRPLWHVLQHIVNHGTHHRSEVGQYLATLDQSPGDLDFMRFVAKKH